MLTSERRAWEHDTGRACPSSQQVERVWVSPVGQRSENWQDVSEFSTGREVWIVLERGSA